MPNRKHKLMLCVLLAWPALRSPTQGQNFVIESFRIEGAGGTSTSAQYCVTGTFARPDVEAPASTNFSVTGGFWAEVIAVQSPDAPRLSIQSLSAGLARISWLPNTPGFVVQEAASLLGIPVNWTNAPAAYTNGAVIPASAQTRFFRLTKP